MNAYEKRFLEAYYKAMETAQDDDWGDALLLAKQMYNYTRKEEDRVEESSIQKEANKLYGCTV